MHSAKRIKLLYLYVVILGLKFWVCSIWSFGNALFHRRRKQGGSRGWCPPCLEELYVAINLTRKEPEARWASAELSLRSTESWSSHFNLIFLTLKHIIRSQPWTFTFSYYVGSTGRERNITDWNTMCTRKLANWEMVSKQITLGVFFSKESVRNSGEPKASAESTKGNASDSESVSETLNDCALGSSSDSTSRPTQNENDRIQPSTQDCTCQCCNNDS